MISFNTYQLTSCRGTIQVYSVHGQNKDYHPQSVNWTHQMCLVISVILVCHILQ